MSYNKKLSQRIAEEAQLLQEEKWIMDALAKIKNQRNCLQIERLVLESMKAQVQKEIKSPAHSQATGNLEHTTQYPDSTPRLEYDEECCNNEELNLNIANNLYGRMNTRTPFSEEDEDDNDDDVVIDMNMLMHGKSI